MPAASSAGANLGFEATLWKAADKLRGSMEPSDYKHVVLGLIFLKYISDAFEAKRAALLADKLGELIDLIGGIGMVDAGDSSKDILGRVYEYFLGQFAGAEPYKDEPGFCKSATLAEVKQCDYVLTPGRYVGMAAAEADDIPFTERFATLRQTLEQQFKEGEALNKTIRQQLRKVSA